MLIDSYWIQEQESDKDNDELSVHCTKFMISIIRLSHVRI